MNAKKAKALRRELKLKRNPNATFKFPGIHHNAKIEVFKRNEKTGKVVVDERGRPMFPEYREQRDEDGNLFTGPAYDLLPIHKPVRLKDSKQETKHNYRRAKAAHRRGRG